MQILTVDLGTDMLPGLALGTELPEGDVMNRPPRSRKERLLNGNTLIKSFLWYGLLESVISMGAYFYVNYLNGWPNVPLAADGIVYRTATTMTLAAIVFTQIGTVLNCRSEKQSVFKIGFFKNKLVIIGIFVEIALISAIMYVPFLQEVFGTAAIGPKDWLFLIIIPIPMVLFEEIRKAIMRQVVKSKLKWGQRV
jgi:magnesium-transporting ATPase (P-type)